MPKILGTTDTAYLYVIGECCGPYKVGFSTSPSSRLKTLRMETKRDLHLLHWIDVPYARARSIELHAHKLLGDYVRDGEWFTAPYGVVVEVVDRAPGEYLAIEHPLRPVKRYDKCAFQADADLFARLDNWRVSQGVSPIPRGTAVRMLLEQALADVSIDRAEALAIRDQVIASRKPSPPSSDR